MKFWPIIYLFFAVTLLPWQAVAETCDCVIPPPPELVKCLDETSCDKNPEHIATFIDAFYKWYILNQEAQEPSQAYEQYFKEYRSTKAQRHISKNVEETLEKTLTHDFWEWRDQLYTSNQIDRKESCHLNKDPILCTQDLNLKDWLYHSPVKLFFHADSKSILGFTVSSSTNPSSVSHLIITMKPESGVWRIDSIKNSLF